MFYFLNVNILVRSVGSLVFAMIGGWGGKHKTKKKTKQKNPNGSLVEGIIKMSINSLLLDFNTKLVQKKRRENRDLVVEEK